MRKLIAFIPRVWKSAKFVFENIVPVVSVKVAIGVVKLQLVNEPPGTDKSALNVPTTVPVTV